jgi:hypothetical protein
MAVYEGQLYEDKRFGVGCYTSPDGFFYLGEWGLGLRHGRGFEGLLVHNCPVRRITCTIVMYYFTGMIGTRYR